MACDLKQQLKLLLQIGFGRQSSTNLRIVLSISSLHGNVLEIELASHVGGRHNVPEAAVRKIPVTYKLFSIRDRYSEAFGLLHLTDACSTLFLTFGYLKSC